MAYGHIHRGEHFGGRILVQIAIEKQMKKQFEREKQMMMSDNGSELEASPNDLPQFLQSQPASADLQRKKRMFSKQLSVGHLTSKDYKANIVDEEVLMKKRSVNANMMRRTHNSLTMAKVLE